MLECEEATRSDGRAVEGGGLENHCTQKVPGVRIPLAPLKVVWSGARVAESGSLLRSCTLTGTEGSNPSYSVFFI